MVDLTVVSLGLGVQSTTLLLMAEAGLITPRPDLAIFADTQSEPSAVYRHLAWIREHTTIPIRVVTAGNLAADALASVSSAWMPLYVLNKDGSPGMLKRQCTKNYKIVPIRREVRAALAERGIPAKPGAVEQWIGISWDEFPQRAKDSDRRYIVNRWPLVEERMDRDDCVAWLARSGYGKPARSACWCCPYLSDAEWRDMKANRPDEFARACRVDEGLRLRRGRYGEAFLHSSRLPLRDVDFDRTRRERRAIGRGQLMFELECEGMCGL